jgi:DNA-binding MarR family transcriptional regulator
MFFLKQQPTRHLLEHYAAIYPHLKPASMANALAILRNASIIMRDLDTYFTQHNLSHTRFLILMLLDENEDNSILLATELAKQLDVSKAVISKSLNALLEDGLVQFVVHPDDSRAKQLLLTSCGKRVLQGVLLEYFDIIQNGAKDA